MKGSSQNWIWWLLGGIVFIVFFRFIFLFRVLFLFVFPMVGLIALGVFFWRRWQKRNQERAFSLTKEGKVQQRLDQCRNLYHANEEEREKIEKNIEELETQLQNGQGLSLTNRRELEDLLREFKREYQVRASKARFFRSCTDKLEILLRNYETARALDDKREALRQLKENNYEELAELEAVRFDLEKDLVYLETIDELSERMIRIDSPEAASGLQLELEKMTNELNRL